MARWWKTQQRTTKVVIVVLILAVGVAISLRLLPKYRSETLPSTSAKPTARPTSSPVPQSSVPCPPDQKILNITPHARSTTPLRDHLCVGDYVSVWARTDPAQEPQLVIAQRTPSGDLELLAFDAVSIYTPAPFCVAYRRLVAILPAQLVERTGCQYWGRAPPADSPHAQVINAQRRFFTAVDTGDTGTVCAMLAPRALAEVEAAGRHCADILPRIKNMLDKSIERGRTQSPTLVQATNEYAATGGPPPDGAWTVLTWQSVNGQWKVAMLWCLTINPVC